MTRARIHIPISEHLRPRQLTTTAPAINGYAPKQLKPEKAHIDQLGDLLGSFTYGELMEVDDWLIKIARTVDVIIDDKGAFAELLWQFFLANRDAQVERALTEIASNLDFSEQSPSFTGDFE